MTCIYNQTSVLESLETIKSRLMALTEGLKTNPENTNDYAEALEVLSVMLEQTIVSYETRVFDSSDLDKNQAELSVILSMLSFTSANCQSIASLPPHLHSFGDGMG